MPGPAKKPTKLKILEGNPGRRPLPENEPNPEPAMPTCPGHLRGAAKKEWGRIVPELYVLGLLTKIDRAALAAYCGAYGRWVEAEKEIAKMRRSHRELLKIRKRYPDKSIQVANGMVRQTTGGNWIMEPMLSVSNKAVEQMHKFLIEFGMTPASRTRIATAGSLAEVKDPLDRVLGTRSRN